MLVLDNRLPPVLEDEDRALLPAVLEAVEMNLCAEAFGWDLWAYRRQPPAYRKQMLLVGAVRAEVERANMPHPPPRH
jgi:hypothetical protein